MTTNDTIGSDRVQTRPIAPADLIALNDEIAALSRTGASLEDGLLDYGRDAKGRLALLAKSLGDRMTQGVGLADAIAEESRRGNLPPLYRAIVTVGLKSGRLPAALEDVARLAQGYVETRRVIAQALVYPVFILVFAYAMFVGLVTEMVPRFVEFASEMRIPVSAPLNLLLRLGESVWYWGFGLPIVLIVAFGVWMISGRGNGIQPGRFDQLARLIPWTRTALSQARAASFADLLALLIDHEVPLDEAVSLAGEATGEFSLRNAANRAADSIRRGESTATSLRDAKAIPPLLRLLIVSSGDRASLVPALRIAAENYRRRSLERARLIRSALPVIFLLMIGGGAVALYAAALFGPVTLIYDNLSRSMG